jgi:NADH-quinone oxidoreductase subunit G
VIGRVLPYDDIETLRERLAEANGVFGRVGVLPRFGITDLTGPGGGGAVSDLPFRPWLRSYYQTDPISRASPTMAACVAEIAPALAVAAE